MVAAPVGVYLATGTRGPPAQSSPRRQRTRRASSRRGLGTVMALTLHADVTTSSP
jgi:hypothetical protein